MNGEELALIRAAKENLGWQMLKRYFDDKRESVLKQVMSPDMDPIERQKIITIQAGRDEVLSWFDNQLKRGNK